MKNILVAGGAGYVGTRLCNELCNNYNITVVDYFWFGDHLNDKIVKIKKDIVDLKVDDIKEFDVIVFVGGLSNDPMANFRPDMNFICNSAAPTYLAYIAKQAGIKKFICASSCSVYGFTNNKTLSENDLVKPAYAYGISKLQCESGIMILEDDSFKPVLFRKGTIGGYSQRMRYDLAINTMVMSGISKGKITVNNGNLWRPLIDIRDVIQGYKLAIEVEEVSGVFNLSGDNYTIGDLGKIVSSKLKDFGYHLELQILENTDVRNYKANIDKMQSTFGFKPMYKPEDTIDELFEKIDFSGYDFTNPELYNIETFKKFI